MNSQPITTKIHAIMGEMKQLANQPKIVLFSTIPDFLFAYIYMYIFTVKPVLSSNFIQRGLIVKYIRLQKGIRQKSNQLLIHYLLYKNQSLRWHKLDKISYQPVKN